MGSKTADVLLKILEKVPDANKVSILLEPNNLLKLLQIYGQSPDGIRQRLTNGTLPGELLLELLEREPDGDRLLAQLGITDVMPTPKRTPQDKPIKIDQARFSPRSKATPTITSQDQPMISPTTEREQSTNLFGNYSFVAGIVIISLTAFVPAFMITGFIPVQALSRETATLIALVGGAIAGAITNPFVRFSWKGLFVGMVYGISALWATILYTQSRVSIIKIEIAIPLLLSTIPAFAVYFVLSKLFPNKTNDSSVPHEL